MANYANLLAQIAANIYSNEDQAITGDILQLQLNAMVASLGVGYQFMGVAHPSDTPSGYADLRAIWLASEAGTYTDFGGLVLADGEVAIIKYDGNGWSKDVTGAATAAQVDDIRYRKDAITGNVIYSAYFTQAAPTIVSYSAGFNVYYYAVKQGDKIRVTATNSQSKALNYGFTSVAPTYNVSVNAAISINTTAVDVTLSAPADGYFVVAKYKDYFTDIAVYNLVDRLGEQEQFNEEIKSLVATINYNAETEESNLDYTDIATQYGAVDTTNGKIISHAQRLVTTDIIPIKELSVIHTLCAASGQYDYYRVGVYFYSVDRFSGNTEYIQDTYYVTTYAQRNHYKIVPKGANGVRFMFSKFVSGVEAKIELSELSNITITSVFPDIYEDTDTSILHLGVGEDLRLNDYSGFIFGTAQNTNFWDKQSTQIIPLAVTPGESYAVFASMENKMFTFQVQFYADINQPYAGSLALGVQTGGGFAGYYFNTFKVPRGVRYIRVSGIGDFQTATFTPQNAVDAEFHIVNITDANLVCANKVLPLVSSSSRYTQGVAAQNGYIFLAYSDGTIDVYDNDFNLVQGNISVPAPSGVSLHLSSLNFMSKRYSESDQFTILMCQPGMNENHYGIRILNNDNVFSFERVCNFAVPTLDAEIYADSQMYFDDINNTAIRICSKITTFNPNYTSGYGDIELTEFSYTGELTGTPTFTEVSGSTFEYPRMFPLQAGKIVNGRLYMVVGTDKKSSYIIGFDLYAKKIVYLNDLRKDSYNIDYSIEPQSFDFYEDRICLATTKGIFIIN